MDDDKTAQKALCWHNWKNFARASECRVQGADIVGDRKGERQARESRKSSGGNLTAQTGRRKYCPRGQTQTQAQAGPLGAFQTSENLINWVNPRAVYLICGPLKINLNAGRKAVPGPGCQLMH